MTKHKCHLVSFADGAFLARAQEFEAEARRTGLFDSLSVYEIASLDERFRRAHENFMRINQRGFGYYIWKPQCVLQALDAVDWGNLVVWLDAGFELNPSGNYRFIEYMQMALDSRYGMLSFSNTHTEYRWTKMDLAYRLGLGSQSAEMMTTQLTSGCVLLKKTPENVQLVRHWRDVAIECDYRFSDDSPSRRANHPEFREHRHDQSIFSLIRKIRGTEVTHYEVQTYDSHYEAIKHKLPLRAARKGRAPRF